MSGTDPWADFEGEDPYALLGVAPDAGPGAVSAAYRRRIREVHADNGSQPDPRLFRLVNLAYSVLGDARTRDVYDEARSAPAPGPVRPERQWSAWDEAQWAPPTRHAPRPTPPPSPPPGAGWPAGPAAGWDEQLVDEDSPAPQPVRRPPPRPISYQWSWLSVVAPCTLLFPVAAAATSFPLAGCSSFLGVLVGGGALVHAVRLRRRGRELAIVAISGHALVAVIIFLVTAARLR